MKIGVFDSGLGGLSVLKHLRQLIPAASFYYIADSANAPYGDKPDAFIAKRSLQISRFLLAQEVSAIVIACNTATAAAVKQIREQIPVPVVAIEPALKPAAKLTKTGHIGVLATESTLSSSRYQQLLESHCENVDYIQQAANGLVEQVEAGQLQQPETETLLKTYLQPMLDSDVDVIVLGCTHYPFLSPLIQRLVGQSVTVLDTGKAVSEQLLRVLNISDESMKESVSIQQPQQFYFTSGDPRHAEKMLQQLLNENARFEKLPV